MQEDNLSFIKEDDDGVELLPTQPPPSPTNLQIPVCESPPPAPPLEEGPPPSYQRPPASYQAPPQASYKRSPTRAAAVGVGASPVPPRSYHETKHASYVEPQQPSRSSARSVARTTPPPPPPPPVHQANDPTNDNRDEDPRQYMWILGTRQIYVLKQRYDRMYRDSVSMLQESKRYERLSLACKIGIVGLGLVTSYVSAISGVSAELKNFVSTSFSLASALISGYSTAVNHAKKAALLYEGYTAYQDFCTDLYSTFLYFESSRSFDELMDVTDKLIKRYEGTLEKSVNQNQDNCLVHIKQVDSMILDRLRKYSDHEKLIRWWSSMQQHSTEVESSDSSTQTNQV